MALIVQKYGGTSVGSVERIRNVARRVAKWRAAGHDVVVVPSAMSGETNRLLALAAEVSAHPDPRELDVVASTGEQVTIGLLAMALWLARQDIARRTVHERGLTRFIAVCLLSGYAWLGAGAAILLADGFLPLIAARDAGLHAILVGFVFSMVFGHAPIIFPAVTRAAMPYHWSFYIPLVLLQASLAIRIAGDFSEVDDWRRLGGMVNAAALALFVLGTVAAVVRGKLAARGKPADGPA